MFYYINNLWMVIRELAPWLLLGLGVAAGLHALLPSGFMAAQLGARGAWNVTKAALFGLPMPLCSCAVIPTALGMRKDGASDGAAIAFLISTPQTGVDSIAVSAGFFGLPFALVKVAVAFVAGVIGGGIADHVAPTDSRTPAEPTRSRPDRTITERLQAGWSHAEEILGSVWGWIVLGVLVSALITSLVPARSLSGAVWTSGLPGMLTVLLVSVPLYVCTTASVPIAAAIVSAGFSPGSAMVFLMAGPATNVATIGAVYRAFGTRLAAIYLSVIVSSSILAGLFLDQVLQPGSPRSAPYHDACGGWIASISAALLLACLLRFAWRDLRPVPPPTAAAETLSLRIEGMTCRGCAAKATNALRRVDGVDEVRIDLLSGKAEIQGRTLSRSALKEAVKEAGFSPIDT